MSKISQTKVKVSVIVDLDEINVRLQKINNKFCRIHVSLKLYVPVKTSKTTMSENKFKILTFKLLREDKNVAQKLFRSEKHVFWSENQLFPGAFI